MFPNSSGREDRNSSVKNAYKKEFYYENV